VSDKLGGKKHCLRSPSSFIVVVLRSLRHGSCVCCGVPLHSFDESAEHWEKELNKMRRETGSYLGYKLDSNKLGERASEVYKKTKSLEKRDKFLHKIVKRVAISLNRRNDERNLW